MKNLMQDSGNLAMSFQLFIAVMLLLSMFGGYQLSHLVNRMNSFYLQRMGKILAMERNFGDATIALGRQIQEWKDMLLRVNDKELYNKHRQAFFAAGATVQEALQLTKSAMRDDGMDTGEIEQLVSEHQSLSSDYQFAKSVLDPKHIDSYLEADKLVIGVDRNLQHHISIVKNDIQQFSNQQLKRAMPAQESRNLLGLVGASSLLIMSLAGYFFAGHCQGNKAGKT